MLPPFYLDAQDSPSLCVMVSCDDRIQLARVVTYIRDHFEEELTLDELARVAGFSKYHFHRLFSEHYGETVGDCVRRIRLEKAALKLIFDGRSSITKIAFDCGFSSSQHFAKSFKIYFGVSPTQVHGKLDWGNILLQKMQNTEINCGQRHCLPVEVKDHGAFVKIPAPADGVHEKDDIQELEVLNMPSYRVAYIRTQEKTIVKSVGNTTEKLAQWAAHKGLFVENSTMISAVGIVPNCNGEYTYDQSVTVPETTVADDENDDVQIQYLPGGLYAVYHGQFQTASDLAATWDRLACGWWISSYFPRDSRPCCNIYYNDPAVHPAGTSFIDICLPITTLCK